MKAFLLLFLGVPAFIAVLLGYGYLVNEVCKWNEYAGMALLWLTFCVAMACAPSMHPWGRGGKRAP